MAKFWIDGSWIVMEYLDIGEFGNLHRTDGPTIDWGDGNYDW